jgi:uncharacterized protein involved in response to NO
MTQTLPVSLLTKTSKPSVEDDKVHPFLSIGFRPFFFLATLTAVGWVPLWLHLLAGGKLGEGSTKGHFSPMVLHAHEMLFGFTAAVIAGFLLTAASNWTGKRTATGRTLLSLCLLWLAARVAVLMPSIPFWLVALIDLSFFPAVALVLAVPIVASKNYRNLPFLIMLLLLFVSNGLMYLERTPLWGSFFFSDQFGLGQTLALRTITLMMIVMGGRVIPMFTRNATRRDNVARNPLSDRIAIATYLVVVLLSAFISDNTVLGALWLFCGGAHLYRMRTWGTLHASSPLLWILHFGYASIAFSFLLEGMAYFGWVPPSVAIHALTVGGIGGLCLGMMTRVSLGHSGRMLAAPGSMTVAFGLLAAAATVRVTGPLFLSSALAKTYQLSGALFTAAFVLLLLFGLPIWFTPRADTQQREVQ